MRSRKTIDMYSSDRRFLGAIIEREDFMIRHELEMDKKTMKFLVPSKGWQAEIIQLEGFACYEDNHFTIKNVCRGDVWTSVEAVRDMAWYDMTIPGTVLEAEYKSLREYINAEKTFPFYNGTLICNGEPWTFKLSPHMSGNPRTWRIIGGSSMDWIKKMCDTYGYEVRIDEANHLIEFYVARQNGVFLAQKGLNVASMEITENSDGYFNSMIGLAKDGNPTLYEGGGTFHNYQEDRFKRVIGKAIVDESEENPENLKDDIEREMSKRNTALKFYELKLYNLARLNNDYIDMKFEIGDAVRFGNFNLEEDGDVRITAWDEYPDEPIRDVIYAGTMIPSIYMMVHEIDERFEVLTDKVHSAIEESSSLNKRMSKITFRNGKMVYDGSAAFYSSDYSVEAHGKNKAYIGWFVNEVCKAWMGFGVDNSKDLAIVNEYAKKSLAILANGYLRYNGEIWADGLWAGNKNVGALGDALWGEYNTSNGLGLSGAWTNHRTLTLTKGIWIIDCGYTANQTGKYLDYEVKGIQTGIIAGTLYCQNGDDHNSTASGIAILDKTTTITLRAWSSNGMTAAKSHYLRATKLIGY